MSVEVILLALVCGRLAVDFHSRYRRSCFFRRNAAEGECQDIGGRHAL